jgi:hypothetical protein
VSQNRAAVQAGAAPPSSDPYRVPQTEICKHDDHSHIPKILNQRWGRRCHRSRQYIDREGKEQRTVDVHCDKVITIDNSPVGTIDFNLTDIENSGGLLLGQSSTAPALQPHADLAMHVLRSRSSAPTVVPSIRFLGSCSHGSGRAACETKQRTPPHFVGVTMGCYRAAGYWNQCQMRDSSAAGPARCSHGPK